MKIVGKTDKGYLVQITEDEIGEILGFGPYPLYGDTRDPFLKETGRDTVGRSIPTDTEIPIKIGFEYIRKIKEKEITARKCAESLREMADLITSGLPSLVIHKELPLHIKVE